MPGDVLESIFSHLSLEEASNAAAVSTAFRAAAGGRVQGEEWLDLTARSWGSLVPEARYTHLGSGSTAATVTDLTSATRSGQSMVRFEQGSVESFRVGRFCLWLLRQPTLRAKRITMRVDDADWRRGPPSQEAAAILAKCVVLEDAEINGDISGAVNCSIASMQLRPLTTSWAMFATTVGDGRTVLGSRYRGRSYVEHDMLVHDLQPWMNSVEVLQVMFNGSHWGCNGSGADVGNPGLWGHTHRPSHGDGGRDGRLARADCRQRRDAYGQCAPCQPRWRI